jgi:hypothetical protein
MVKIVYICAFENCISACYFGPHLYVFFVFCAFFEIAIFFEVFSQTAFYAFEIDFFKHILRKGNL